MLAAGDRPMSAETVFWVAIYLAGVNTITLAAYALDKSQAQNGGWRISESNLLFLGFIGGSLGAFVAQRFFRHKTRKAEFQAAFWFCVALQLLIIGLVFVLINGAHQASPSSSS
jgi:uncharacterized membrane protein YsdA (DUF1294 family)